MNIVKVEGYKIKIEITYSLCTTNGETETEIQRNNSIQNGNEK